jgi:hypothetical protein
MKALIEDQESFEISDTTTARLKRLGAEKIEKTLDAKPKDSKLRFIKAPKLMR